MKIKHQVSIAVLLLVVLATWAFFELLLPWLSRTASDPELESRAPVEAPPDRPAVLAMAWPGPAGGGVDGD